MGRACLAVPLLFLLTAAEAGVGASGHGHSSLAHDDDAKRSEAARQFLVLFTLYNESFKALVKRAETLQSEVSAAVEKYERAREALKHVKDSRVHTVASKLITSASPNYEMLKQKADIAVRATCESLHYVSRAIKFSANFTLSSASRGNSRLAVTRVEKQVCWYEEVMKRVGHNLTKQLQAGYAVERAEAVGILDPEKIVDSEGFHRWRDKTKHLFVNQALELGRVAGLFVRHVVEEQVRAMEKSTALRFDTIMWNNVVGKDGTIDTYVKKVVDVLNGTQLQLMLQELDNATVPLADALKAMKGLRDETKMIDNEVDSVKREAFCRATVFLAKLQKRRDELVNKLSDLARHCAAEESLEATRNTVTSTNFAVVKAQRSVLESEEKTVSILTETQKVMAESEHGANQRETTGKLVKIAEEAREDVRKADVFVSAAIGEARHAAVALMSANSVCAAVAKTSKLETALATAANESVLNITLHLDAIGRVAPCNEVRSSPGSCTNKHNVSSYELEALQASIANVDAFHGMDKVVNMLVALTESVKRLEGGVENISKDAQVATVELQKALRHAGKAAEHAECAEKAVGRADARMKEVAAMLGGVSNKNIRVDAVCSLMRQLNGAKKRFARLIQETLKDERRAADARRVAADHGDSAPLAKKAAERSAEELELVRKGAKRIREGAERDVQSIDLHLVSLRNVLLNLNSGRANGSRNLTAFCDEAQDNVTDESIQAAVVRLVRSRGIADAATAQRRVRDVAADLTTLHALSRDAGSHSERAAAYAEESIALSKGEGASRSVASARSGDAGADSVVDAARQTSVLGTSDNATLSASSDAEEAQVVGGKLSGNTALVMWVLVIGLSLLFLLLVFLFSLRRRIRNEAKGHVAPSELSGPSHDLKSLCHSFVEVKSVGDCVSGMESENWCELECSDSNLSFPALEYFDEMVPKKE